MESNANDASRLQNIERIDYHKSLDSRQHDGACNMYNM